MLQKSLNGKVALITGGARRIGKEIVHALHDEGMRVIIHYSYSEKDAQAFAKKLNDLRSDSAKVIKADFTEKLNLDSLVASIMSQFGEIHALINNASQFIKTPIEEIHENSFDDLIRVNLKIPFLLSQALSPHLKITQGSIVNITDIHGVCPLKEYGTYSISKAGLIMATKVLAKELAPDIRVNAISPGAILWPEGDNTLAEDVKEKIVGSTVLKRAGNAREVAGGVLFFIRDASYSSGQVLSVDGGRLLSTI